MHTCPCCSRSLTSRKDLMAHLRAEHTGLFACSQCHVAFKHTSRLLVHWRVHSGEKPYNCQYCPRTFSTRSNCVRHLRLHSAEERRQQQLEALVAAEADVRRSSRTEAPRWAGAGENGGGEQVQVLETRAEAGRHFGDVEPRAEQQVQVLDARTVTRGSAADPAQVQVLGAGREAGGEANPGDQIDGQQVQEEAPDAAVQVQVPDHLEGQQVHLSQPANSSRKRFNCELCDKGFEHLANYRFHVRRHLRAAPEEPEGAAGGSV